MKPILEINLKNLEFNLQRILSVTDDPWIVVKENAYGLGLRKISEALYAGGIRKFIVIDIFEGVALRRFLNNKTDIEICVLNGFYELDQMQECIDYKLLPMISHPEMLKNWVKNTKHTDFGVFLETGLNRYSLREEDIDEIVDSLRGMTIRLVISHLACARNPKNRRNEEQRIIFDALCDKISKFADIQEKSLGASDALFFLDKKYRYDSYRIGSALYGFNTEINNMVDLRNVVSLSAPILKTFHAEKGDYIGYGDDCIVNRDSKIAILNIGIAHGLYRSMSNVGKFFIKQNQNIHMLPIIGGITMDYTTLDITDAPFVEAGDHVYLFDYEIGIPEQLDLLRSQEQIIRLNKAIPRPYHKEFSLNLYSSKNEIHYIG